MCITPDETQFAFTYDSKTFLTPKLLPMQLQNLFVTKLFNNDVCIPRLSVLIVKTKAFGVDDDKKYGFYACIEN